VPVYCACFRCVMTYGSETWPLGVEKLRRLERAEKMMIRWICGVTLSNGKTSEEIRNGPGMVSVSDMVRLAKIKMVWVCRA
jgi:hypothetical protein